MVIAMMTREDRILEVEKRIFQAKEIDFNLMAVFHTRSNRGYELQNVTQDYMMEVLRQIQDRCKMVSDQWYYSFHRYSNDCSYHIHCLIRAFHKETVQRFSKQLWTKDYRIGRVVFQDLNGVDGVLRYNERYQTSMIVDYGDFEPLQSGILQRNSKATFTA